MVGIVPISGTQQFDKNSSPPAFLVGGRLFVYLTGTSTPAPVFSDPTLTAPLAFPTILDTSGRIPAIYGADGLVVRLRLLSSTDVIQFDEGVVPLVSTTFGGGGGGGDGASAEKLWRTGMVMAAYDNQPRQGFVRANGRTIGASASGAGELASDTLAHDLFFYLWPFTNISVVSGKGASANADWVANKQLILPDAAGRLIGARDDLGAGSKGRITFATVTSGVPTEAGSTGGLEKVSITQSQLPDVNFAVSGITLSPHQHFIANTDVLASSAVIPTPTNFVATQNASGAAVDYGLRASGTTATIGLTSPTTAGVSNQGVAASGGGGAALPTMPPVMLFTVYIKL